MANDGKTEWIDNQFRARGWTESEIKKGHKYEKWASRAMIGGFLCLLVVGIPIGLPLFIVGMTFVLWHRDPGKDYYEEKKELKSEFKRRDKNGEPLFDNVSDEWWTNRLANPRY